MPNCGLCTLQVLLQSVNSTTNQVQSPPYQNIHTVPQLSPHHSHSSQAVYNSQAATGSTSNTGTYANIPYVGQHQGKTFDIL